MKEQLNKFGFYPLGRVGMYVNPSTDFNVLENKEGGVTVLYLDGMEVLVKDVKELNKLLK